jgi:hypothetical protein
MKMKKMVLIGVGVVLLLLVLQLAKRMEHGAWSVADSGSGTEQVDSLATKNTKTHEKGVSVVSGGSPTPATMDGGDVVPSQPIYSADELSDPVKALLGLDGQERNYSELLAEIHKLGTDLSAADVAALRDMLNFLNDQFPEKMRPIEINAVKNDVLDKLLRQKELSEGLGIQIAEMAGNPLNDSVWRDYCVQFMEPFYERCSAESMEHGAGSGDAMPSALSAMRSEQEAVREAMFSALNERSETIAGTALIGLELLSRDHEEFAREQIVEKAVKVASDWNASPSCRLTALRLSAAGNLKPETGNLNEEVGNIARTLAQTGDTVLLRSAAIVTLGETGTADDRELLESYTLSENKQIASAAQMALQKMKERD